jgi:hypothetical protein
MPRAEGAKGPQRGGRARKGRPGSVRDGRVGSGASCVPPGTGRASRTAVEHLPSYQGVVPDRAVGMRKLARLPVPGYGSI